MPGSARASHPARSLLEELEAAARTGDPAEPGECRHDVGDHPQRERGKGALTACILEIQELRVTDEVNDFDSTRRVSAFGGAPGPGRGLDRVAHVDVTAEVLEVGAGSEADLDGPARKPRDRGNLPRPGGRRPTGEVNEAWQEPSR